MPSLALDLLDEQFFGFVARQARHPFELALLLRDELFVLRGGRRGALFTFAQCAIAVVQFLLEPLDGRLPIGRGRLAPAERLFERGGLLPLLTGPAIGLHQDLVRFFLRVEQRFLLARFRVAVGVLHDAERLFLRTADRFGRDALAVGDPHRVHSRRRNDSDEDVDQ